MKDGVKQQQQQQHHFLVILVSILVITFMVESQIGYIADFIPDIVSSPGGVAGFIAAGIVFAVGGILMLQYLKTRNIHSRPIHIGVTVILYLLIAIIAFVVAEILITSQYHSASVLATVTISSALWIVISALLAKALISWIRATGGGKKKRNLVVFVFALAMIAEVVTAVTYLTTDWLAWHSVDNPPQEIVLSSDVAFFGEFDPTSLSNQVETVYQIAAAVAYVLTWIGVVILLRPYVQRIGKIKFYAIMVTVMVFYLIGYPLYILGYYNPTPEGISEEQAMYNVLILGIGTVLSGAAFGAAFLAVARTLRKDSALRGYMMLAAYGYILYMICGSAVVTQLAYPPYGLASVGFIGISYYLIYVGLYSAAVSVSQDYRVRESIRNEVKKESSSKLLEEMGMGQLQQEKKNLVVAVGKKSAKQLAEETGVESTMTEDDMKDYMDEVMKELENVRK